MATSKKTRLQRANRRTFWLEKFISFELQLNDSYYRIFRAIAYDQLEAVK